MPKPKPNHHELREILRTMKMTKKARAAAEALAFELDTMAALRWTEPVLPDVPPPSRSKEEDANNPHLQVNGWRRHTEGWSVHVYNNTIRVDEAWSEFLSHGNGSFDPDKRYPGGSQGSRWLYSSRLRALQAARSELARQAGVALAKADRAIHEELSALST